MTPPSHSCTYPECDQPVRLDSLCFRHHARTVFQREETRVQAEERALKAAGIREVRTPHKRASSPRTPRTPRVLQDAEHGSRTAYRNGCTCDLCRTGNTERAREQRERKMGDMTGIPHGTMRAYTRGCRCAECRAVNAARVRNRVRRG